MLLWGMWEFNMDIFDADWCNQFNASLGADFAPAAVQSIRPLCQIVPVGEEVVDGEMTPYSVSYTHLTLPTICSV